MPTSSSASQPTKIDPEAKRALLSAALAERERRRRMQTYRFAQWREDPAGFVERGLLGFLWSKQREIVESVMANRQTAVASCHDVGKTYTAAAVVAWWLSVWDPGDAFCVTTAPTFHQVRALLWREIGRLHRAGNLPGTTNQVEWHIGNELVAFGRKPDDLNPTAFQGIHARRVLVVGDEACGLASAIVEAAETLIANEDSRALWIGNPDDPATPFGAMCKPGSGCNVINISAFDSPNFTDEEVPDWLRPLLVSKTWVEERRRKWGEESPLWKSKVLGQFPEQSTDGLVPLAALTAAQTRTLDPGLPNELGVDVARFGDDHTVMIQRLGQVARRVERYAGKDTMKTVGHIVRLHALLGFTRVKVDDIGVGGGVSDRLNELAADPDSGFKNCEVVRINVSESPARQTEHERFKNLRAELNWNMRERFIAGEIDIDEKDDDLVAQAAEIKYDYQSTGHIIIEKKAETKKRLNGKSPDDWDALVLAFAEASFPGAGMLAFVKSEAAAVGAAREAALVARGNAASNGHANGAGGHAGRIGMRAPSGISTFYGALGDRYLVEDGIAWVKPDDVPPAKSAGFCDLEAG